ncbi:isopenicillin N synthase-like dioxygenase [Rhizobium sp. BK312]|uniref:isopenicillin N synthase family dioxygenase n=1 Tax=Rhizobium sp. BK312 TaxID=2587080 RepID=UPI000DDA9257|nr:2-oxoglutarate and iron-dependent oxygenase domain-containing protein [Rhizobium sp. BK312]MBB3424063.1 isopenicillin N synthase-like dioxygenase [Rhizobium sp. BK312]
MQTITAPDEVQDSIPVIDIAPFIAGAEASPKVVTAIEDACRRTGFFLVTGHGVSADVTTRLYNLARDFFDEPQEWKIGQGRGTSIEGGVAFSPIADEALAATLGIKTPGDYKESLNFGPRLPGDLWPTRPEGLEQAFADYFTEMEKLAGHLRRAFCEALGLAPDYFEPAFENHLSALRVINYPEQKESPLPGQLRAGVHTDYGFMTILRSEASPGGLQVKNRAGDWLDAPNVEGAYVINIGDAFMRWSNDEWLSTPHRVANPPGAFKGATRRQSIPFFLNPSRDTVIECLAPFAAKGAAKYEPITYGDYISLKTSQAFGKS